MERYTRSFLAGIDRWISQSVEIDSLDLSGDLALGGSSIALRTFAISGV